MEANGDVLKFSPSYREDANNWNDTYATIQMHTAKETIEMIADLN